MGNEITGGNWTVQDNSEDGYGQIRVDSDTFGAVAVCYSGGNGEKENVSWALANAKLIAAAPELLDFAIHMQAYFVNNPNGYEGLREACREAITKATT